MKRILTLLTAISFYTLHAQTINEDSAFIKQMSDNIMSSNKASENLYHLTKKIGARLAGSDGMYKAEKWGLETMQTYKNANVYYQQCMVPHWVRGGQDKFFIKEHNKKKQELSIVALGNSLGAGKKGVSGEVVMVNSLDELKTTDIKDKIVYINYKFDDNLIRTFEAYGKASVVRRNAASMAAQYGAKAVVIHSLSHGDNNFPHTGAMAYDSAYKKIPAAALGNYDAATLEKLLTSKTKITAELFTHGYFLPDTIGNNVIAEIIGSTYPDEIITLGGHLDSWDNCEGAHDDGAGIVQTIEVLRVFNELNYKPKRTIRFVLFANEENGLRGGTKYAEDAKAKNENHIFALESDAGGFTPRGFSLSMSAEKMNKILQWKSLFTPYGGDGLVSGGGGADIGPLARAFKTPLAGLQPDSQRYFDFHHAANDTYENVNPRELKLGAVNMAALIYLVDKYGL